MIERMYDAGYCKWNNNYLCRKLKHTATSGILFCSDKG